MNESKQTVFILGLSSDIGFELGRRFLADGYRVYGTYRTQMKETHAPSWTRIFPCDVSDPESIRAMVRSCDAEGLNWNVFLGVVGTEEPIGPFFDCDFDEWERGIHINALGLLRAFHELFPLRQRDQESSCILFSGAGTNNASVNYSAYSASKIFLIKMCEILAAENPDLNPVILGPGIVRTKIHQQTLKAGTRAGANYKKVEDYLSSEESGVSHDDIYELVRWTIRSGRESVGGRNLSLVHDAWRQGGEPLRNMLRSDPDAYKLRRSKNSWKPGSP